MQLPGSEPELVALALALGAERVGRLSKAEEALAVAAPSPQKAAIAHSRAQLEAGEDPLGETFCELRSPEERRPRGATYTPAPIVEAMICWAKKQGEPARVVDPGLGSARFLVAAGRAFPNAELVGVELDPVAALLGRANLAAVGFANRSTVHLADYRELRLPKQKGPTLFVGNPPYVRHHLIGAEWKEWLSSTAKRHGLEASQLAGLHVHFFLATLELATPGDRVVFVTAAEWLDVNYGKVVRDLFLNKLGGQSLHFIEPTAAPFPDAQTTAVIACCTVPEKPKSIRVRRVARAKELRDLQGGRVIRRERLEAARRWTPLFRATMDVPEGFVELGELCRVHRGQVTGANKVWIEGEHSSALPESVLFPSITKARELIAAGASLKDASTLRRVIDIPADLDELMREERTRVDKFLRVAKEMGADKGFIATHRRAWWAVGLRQPAPILTTYMARRAPAFVRNLAEVRHINIAHGIYPREPLSARALDTLAAHLGSRTKVSDGRTYAGGLTKFEPSEVERLLVPRPEALERGLVD